MLRTHLHRIDFEDTYDGLGDQLEETNDDLNDATFGGGGTIDSTSKPVGKDFDFYGQTAKVSDSINEEHYRYNRQQPPTKRYAPQQTKSYKTGYEAYQNPDYIPDLQETAGIWGPGTSGTSKGNTSQSNTPRGQTTGAPAKKMMSLEEVEAAMQTQATKSAAPAQAQTKTDPAVIQNRSQHQPDRFGQPPVTDVHSFPPQQMPYQQAVQPQPSRPPTSQMELPAPVVTQSVQLQSPLIMLLRSCSETNLYLNVRCAIQLQPEQSYKTLNDSKRNWLRGSLSPL